MKLVLNEDGSAVVENGMPVYEYEDGTKQPFDAKATIGSYEKKVSNLTEEKDRHYGKVEELTGQLKSYGRIKPEQAKEYAAIAKKLEDKQLVDEHGLEAHQRQWTEDVKNSLGEEFAAKESAWGDHKTELETKIADLEAVVFDQAVTNQFASHPYFSGDNPKTVYKAEHAAKIFGDRFGVEIEGRNVKVLAKDNDGKPMLSKKNHGELATFGEAIELMVQADSESHSIFRAPSRTGPGVNSNLSNNTTNVSDSAKPVDKIKAGLKKYYGNHRGF